MKWITRLRTNYWSRNVKQLGHCVLRIANFPNFLNGFVTSDFYRVNFWYRETIFAKIPNLKILDIGHATLSCQIFSSKQGNKWECHLNVKISLFDTSHFWNTSWSFPYAFIFILYVSFSLFPPCFSIYVISALVFS